jgi:acetyl esterase/lipase
MGQPLPMNPMLPGGLISSTAKPTISDVAYGNDPLERLDLFQPVDAKSAPVVVFVHGGAWSVGDKAQYGIVGEQLARDGVLVVLVNYRLSPAVQHPAHVQDVAKAIAWVERNAASYGGDPQRLSLVGHSAGAQLAALVALDPTYLQAEGYPTSIVRNVVGIAGAGYDLDAYYASTPLAPMLASAFGQDTSRWAAAAPVRYVQPYAPPFFLTHGLSDPAAPVSSTQTFAAALTRDGVPLKLEILPNEDHLSIVVTALPAVAAYVGGSTVDPSTGEARRRPAVPFAAPDRRPAGPS